MQRKSNDPLEGKTLERIVTELVEAYGWAKLAKKVSINCFRFDPSIKSSLVFLRRTPWARKEVENLYLQFLRENPIEAKQPNHLKSR